MRRWDKNLVISGDKQGYKLRNYEKPIVLDRWSEMDYFVGEGFHLRYVPPSSLDSQPSAWLVTEFRLGDLEKNRKSILRFKFVNLPLSELFDLVNLWAYETGS